MNYLSEWDYLSDELQERIIKLERKIVELTTENERLQVVKIHNTADGEFPAEKQEVLFENEYGTWLGGYDHDAGLWFYNEAIFKKSEYPVYWKPQTSLKHEYEVQNGC